MSPVKMSRIETAVRVVLAFNKAFNNQDVAGMMKLISDDCIFESVDDQVFTGKEAIAQYWQNYMSQKPCPAIIGEDVFGLGFRTIMRWQSERVEHGEKQIIRGVDIFHVKNGLICNQYSYTKLEN